MKKIVIVCGPTATGKTSFAVDVAKKIDGEIVSADSVAVYRGLDVGSAKPTEEEKGGIRHHLIDVVSPHEGFSVSDYERLALEAIDEITAKGKIPIVCGGTGFYIRSVLCSFSYGGAPENRKIREKYAELIEKNGKNYVYEKLREVDLETAEKLHPNDVMRVVRALEIYETTGRKKSEIRDEAQPRFDAYSVMPLFPRPILYRRIETRVDEMMKRGLLGEVKGLLENGVPENAQCMQAIGYKELIVGLKNGDIPSAVEEIKRNSRRYAKRQITFFKTFPSLRTFDGESLFEREREISNIYDFIYNN